jgi:hypothetical protein
MRWRRVIVIFRAAAVTVAAFSSLCVLPPWFLPAVAAGAQWMLMSREGGCVEVGSLKRRIPDLGEVGDPYSFIRREIGHQVSSNEISGAKGKAVEVKVPEKELFLVFVAPELCEKTRAR